MDMDAVVPGEHEAEDLIGKLLDNRYRLLDQLGEGGMGTVYRAEHVLLGEQVAVKILSPRFAYDREWVHRFLIEARAARRIHHPNVVHIIDVVAAGPGLVYMVMELLSGETLGALVRRVGPLPWPRAFRIATQIAGALLAAHALGVVHRDVKPANCMVSTEAGVDHAKVLDFGIAKLTEARDSATAPRTVTGLWMGTAEYMAPEMFRSEPASASMDIYALGVVLYKLLTGVTPFRGSHIEVATQLAQRDADPPSLKSATPLPAAVDAVVMRAIARDVAARTPSMAALIAEMAAVLALPPEPEVDAAVPASEPPEPDEVEPDTSAVPGRVHHGPATDRSMASTFVGRNLPALFVGSALLSVVLVGLLLVKLGSRGDDVAPVEAAIEGQLAAGEPVTPAAPPPTIASATLPSSVPPEPAASPLAAPEPVAAPASEAAIRGATDRSPSRSRSGGSAKKSGKRAGALPDKLTVADLRAELATMRGTLQDKCFRANRAIAGTSVQIDIDVDASGAATVRLATRKYAAIGACLEYWIRGHKFAASRTGGQIEHVFVAE
jgi:serine/threonine protein kinase